MTRHEQTVSEQVKSLISKFRYLYEACSRNVEMHGHKVDPASPLAIADKALSTSGELLEAVKGLESISVTSTKWLPISEAPKDGTWVLVSRCDREDLSLECEPVIMARWNEKWQNFMTELSNHIHATHFMPLPQPPVGESDGK